MTALQLVLADWLFSISMIRNDKTGAILQDAFQAFDLCWRKEKDTDGNWNYWSRRFCTSVRKASD